MRIVICLQYRSTWRGCIAKPVFSKTFVRLRTFPPTPVAKMFCKNAFHKWRAVKLTVLKHNRNRKTINICEKIKFTSPAKAASESRSSRRRFRNKVMSHRLRNSVWLARTYVCDGFSVRADARRVHLACGYAYTLNEKIDNRTRALIARNCEIVSRQI